MADSNKDIKKAKAQAASELRAKDMARRGHNSNPGSNERNNSDGNKENHSQKAKGQTKK